MARKIKNPEYRGCPLLLAQAEFPDPDHSTHQLVAAHKRRMRDGFTVLAEEAGAQDPRMLADTLALLMDGAWSSLPYLGGKRAAAVLRETAGTVLLQALGRGAATG